MLTLALLILGGAVITTLVQAEDEVDAPIAPPSYLQPELYRPAPAPSRHHWLLPANVQTRFEDGRYNISFQSDSVDRYGASGDEPEARMTLSVGDPRAEQAAFVDTHARAMMSDWERNRYRVYEPVFSMSVGRSW